MQEHGVGDRISKTFGRTGFCRNVNLAKAKKLKKKKRCRRGIQDYSLFVCLFCFLLVSACGEAIKKISVMAYPRIRGFKVFRNFERYKKFATSSPPLPQKKEKKKEPDTHLKRF